MTRRLHSHRAAQTPAFDAVNHRRFRTPTPPRHLCKINARRGRHSKKTPPHGCIPTDRALRKGVRERPRVNATPHPIHIDFSHFDGLRDIGEAARDETMQRLTHATVGAWYLLQNLANSLSSHAHVLDTIERIQSHTCAHR